MSVKDDLDTAWPGLRELSTLKARVAELEASVAAYDSAESRMSGELSDALEALRAAEAELADLRGRVERAEAEAVQRTWAAMGELTSYVVDGDHMVRVDDVRRTFERALEALRGR